MKKKFCFLLLIVLIMPLFALMGCGEVESYNFSFTKSSEMSGSIYGTGISSTTGKGTFSEGTIISITANANKYFLGWIFQGSLLLTDGGNYTISNTLNEDETIKTSTLSFAANSSTAGNYTAVFFDNNVMYAKFDGFRISKDEKWPEPVDEVGEQDLLFESINQMSISQGTSNFTNIYLQNNIPIYDNVKIKPENEIYDIIRLTNKNDSTRQPKQINASLRLDANKQITFNTNIYYKNSDESIKFSDGTYDLKFTFSVNEENYYLYITYKSLS